MSPRPIVTRPRPLPPRRPAAGADPRAGFSLVEMMVALILLGLGILTLANLFPLGSRTQTQDRLRTSATDLAAQKMEQLRLKAWSDAELDVGTSAVETLVLQDEGTFTRWYTVEAQTGNFADIKKVTSRVTWAASRPDTIDLVTYFRR